MLIRDARQINKLADALLPHANVLGSEVRDIMRDLLSPAYKRLLAGHVPSHFARDWDQNTPAEPATHPVTLGAADARQLARPGAYLNEHGDTADVEAGGYTQVAVIPRPDHGGQVVITNQAGQYFAAHTDNLPDPFPNVVLVDFAPVIQCHEERVIYLPPHLNPPF